MAPGTNRISIHPYLLTAIITVVTAAFVAWGLISVNNVKTTRNEKDITEIKTEMKTKADKEDITMIHDILKEIKTDIKDIKDGKDK